MGTLVFSLDQGWANGVTAARDYLAVRRIATALTPLNAVRDGRGGKAYDVCVGITPSGNSWGGLLAVLDQCVNSGLPFVLDVVSSDVLCMGRGNWCCPWNLSHGVARSVFEVIELGARYGAWMRGFRFHEVNSLTWTMQYRREWLARIADQLPYDSFRQQVHLEPFVAFARQTGRFVIWSDPVWSGMGNNVPEVTAGEQLIRDLTDRYPGTVIPMYANNLGGPATENAYWPYLWPVFRPGTRGWGLSNQSWIIPDATALGRWAQRALRGGASVVQFEPAWFWFKLPVGSFTDASEAAYTADPAWADRGSPLPSLQTLTAALAA